MKNDAVCHIPSQNILERRFSFVDNKILRTNIAIAFRYIIFLLTLESETKLPGAISYSIYKDVILYTATIIESCIHYCLRKSINSETVKSSSIMPWDWKDSKCVNLYKISKEEKVCGVVRHKASEKFSHHTQFQTLNRAALKAGILNKTLFDKAENLRQKRNRIHLAGLKKSDDFYEKKDTQEAFEKAKVILERIEKKLSELSNK